MDENNIIYYLVLGAIYLISRFLKKKKPVPTNAPRPLFEDGKDSNDYQEPMSQPSATPKPASFEDLLKEISNEFNERKESKPVITEVEAPIEAIAPVREIREKTREEKYVERRHKEMAADDRIKEIKRLADEEEAHDPHAVMELLQEDGGAANAIILSEIMNKKY